MTDYRYQVGGSLNHQDISYIEREADIQLYQALQNRDFCYVLNSRQMGKSSLLVRTKHRFNLPPNAQLLADFQPKKYYLAYQQF